jgi:enamine deaminase RidA (YjgF/YER057c/UK114 family)
MSLTVVNPPALGSPQGYSHGIAAPTGRLLFVAGQIGWDGSHRLVGPDLTSQFRQALANVLAVVRAAGGAPEHVVRLTLYVVDCAKYRRERRAIGQAYRSLMGKHYPAMALLEPSARVEIEATAVLP